MKEKVFMILKIVVALAAVAGILFILLQPEEPVSQPIATGKTVEDMIGTDEAESVTFRGKTYLHKKNVKSYLLMGIDRDGEAVPAENLFAGQADTLVVLVVDADAEAYTALQLDRDTVMDVEVLSPDGTTVVDTQFMQICLAHTTGTGMEDSCENTVRAVSNLLCGEKIDGYASLTMDAMPLLNDAVGGVPVTIEDDFSQDDPSLVQWETITLDGQQAYHFLRGRMSVGDGTNASRMRRQREYLSSFLKKLRQCVAEDSGFAVSLYQDLKPYMVSDISGKEINELAGVLPKYQNNGFVNFSGEHLINEGYVEFHVDELNLSETLLSLFYDEAEIVG